MTSQKSPQWTVAEATAKHVLLAHPDRDFRLSVSERNPLSDEPHVMKVYPCGSCGWAFDCEDGCHS